MPDADAGFRYERGQVVVDRGDGLDAVMDKKHLSAAIQFAHNRFPHQFLVIRTNVGNDRQAFLWRRVDVGNIPDAAQRHIQGARDRCGSEGEHVHFGAQLFEMLFVGHAKTLLFINNDQSEVFEFDIG